MEYFKKHEKILHCVLNQNENFSFWKNDWAAEVDLNAASILSLFMTR
jgi:membrane-bound lytic murein transglycosylase